MNNDWRKNLAKQVFTAGNSSIERLMEFLQRLHSDLAHIWIWYYFGILKNDGIIKKSVELYSSL